MQANTANRILLHQRSSFELGPDFELGQNGTVLLNGKSNVQHRPSLLGMEQEAQEAREYKLWQVSAATPFCATKEALPQCCNAHLAGQPPLHPTAVPAICATVNRAQAGGLHGL